MKMQPSQKHLVKSAEFSLARSKAGMMLEQINFAVQQTLLGEMKGQPIFVGTICFAISTFAQALGALSITCANLSQQMEDEGRKEPETLNSPALVASGKRMAAVGMVSYTHFHLAAAHCSGGLSTERPAKLYGILEHVSMYLNHLSKLTDRLAARAKVCEVECEQGGFQKQLQENGAGNLLPELFHLQTAWADFNAYLQASDAVILEAYYMHNGQGSFGLTVCAHLAEPVAA
jgi:hypothetical protein